MPHIEYAGVPLLLEDPDHVFQTWLDRTLPLKDLNIFSGPSTFAAEGRNRTRQELLPRTDNHAIPNVALPTPNYSMYRPPRWKINSLWWPTGAARHSIGLFLATDAELEAIQYLLKKSSSNTADLIIAENAEAVYGDRNYLKFNGMTMLPPTPLTAPTQQEGTIWQTTAQSQIARDGIVPRVWLLTLVDDRYFWPNRTTGNFSLTTSDTWDTVIDTLASRLGITIVYDPVDSVYGKPDITEVSRSWDNSATLLDAVAHTLGRRVVFTPWGHHSLLSASDSTLTIAYNASDDPQVLGGGSTDSLAEDLPWQHAIYPEQVDVVFPVRNWFQRTIDYPKYFSSVASDFLDSPQTNATVKRIYTTALADYSGFDDGGDTSEYLTNDPANLTDMEALAEQIASDFYNYIAVPQDFTIPSLWDWELSGFDDYVWWHFAAQREHCREIETLPEDPGYDCYTRVVSHAPDFGVSSQLSQLLDPVPAVWIGECTGTEWSILALDTRDATDGLLLGDKTGEVAVIYGSCFQVGTSTTSYDPGQAIHVPVSFFVADCNDDACGGTGGSGGAEVCHFTLTADLSLSATTAAATIVTSTGSTTGSITVTDSEAKFSALTGYKGYAVKLGTAWEILEIEGHVRFADFTAVDDSDCDTEVILCDSDELYGNAPNGYDYGTALTDVNVYKTSFGGTEPYPQINQGDKLRAIWDEVNSQWKLWWYSGLHITVVGTAASVYTEEDDLITINLTAGQKLVNGWRVPTGTTLSVANDPPSRMTSGDTVYARYNHQVSGKWDLGDAGNFLHHLRGVGSFDAAEGQLLWHDASGTPKWTTAAVVEITLI